MKRGKPKRIWTYDIKNWLEMSVKKAGNLTYDRDQYRRQSQAATSISRQTSQSPREGRVKFPEI